MHTATAQVVTLDALLALREGWRAGGKRVVWTNGCFDLLHAGHVAYLERARRHGDLLIVGINSDASVRRIKGKGRPLQAEKDRSLVLAALASVDAVVVFDGDTPIKLIRTLSPDVLAKGADWAADEIVGREEVLAAGGRVVRVPLRPGASTSSIIKKVVRSNRSPDRNPPR